MGLYLHQVCDESADAFERHVHHDAQPRARQQLRRDPHRRPRLLLPLQPRQQRLPMLEDKLLLTLLVQRGETHAACTAGGGEQRGKVLGFARGQRVAEGREGLCVEKQRLISHWTHFL